MILYKTILHPVMVCAMDNINFTRMVEETLKIFERRMRFWLFNKIQVEESGWRGIQMATESKHIFKKMVQTYKETKWGIYL